MTLPPGFKFISGGQTGADRAALDVALKMNIACGGWCPEDRSAEDGAIELKYPLIPAPGAGYRDRTRLNVRDSDGTVIMGAIPLRGGSLGTLSECLALNKPHLVIDRSSTPVRKAAQLLREFVRD